MRRPFLIALALVAGFLVPSPAQADTEFCGDKPATIVGTRGDDTIHGTFEDDVIVGLGGADMIDGSTGDDIICGGRGGDTFRSGYGRDWFSGDEGRDLITFSYEMEAVQVVLPSRTEPGRATSSEDPGEIDVLVRIENVEGTRFADQIQGSLVRNVLLGGDGNDTISAWDGMDEVDGGDGDDSIDGGRHPDVLEGGEGNDEIEGNASRFHSYVYRQDVLSGGLGDDVLRGEAGNDELTGGPGNDVLDGGPEPASLFGNDVVSFVTSPAGVKVDLPAEVATGDGTDVLIDIEDADGSAFDDVFIGNAEGNQFDAGAGNDELRGGYGIDFLFPGEGQNVVDGGEGGEEGDEGDFVMYVFNSTGVHISSEPGAEKITNVELIYGTHYDDVIRGSSERDRIFTWQGNDYISGGAGDDHLDAGSGDDDEVDGGPGTDVCAGAERVTACEETVEPA